MADLAQEMVLDLVVQSAEQPRQHAVSAGEIYRRLYLMDGPVGLHPLAAGCGNDGQGEGRLLDAMGELKDDRQHDAADERGMFGNRWCSIW